MPMTNVPAFAQTPKSATAVVTTVLANLSADAPTGAVLLLTAGANGAIVTRLTAMPRATVTASSLVLFEQPQGTSNLRMKDSELMPTQAISTGAAIAETAFANYSEARPLRLGAGEALYVGSQNSTNIVFCAEYTDY